MAERDPSTPEKGDRQHLLKAVAAGAVAFAFFGASELRNHSGDEDSQNPPNIPALSAKYQTESYDPYSKSAFEKLTTLSTANITKPRSTEEKRKFGSDLQHSIARISQMSFFLGLDNRAPLDQAFDEYDVAFDLIPKSSQETLDKEGFHFTAIGGPACDNAGVNDIHGYTPLDYSNHLPGEFSVKAKNVGGKEEIRIPLGARQRPLASNPIFWRYQHNRDLLFADTTVLPCETIPHFIYPPNSTTYPADFSFLKQVW